MRTITAMVLAAALGFSARPAAAQAEIKVHQDVNLRFGVLGQFWGDTITDPVSNDQIQNLFVPRLRLISGGKSSGVLDRVIYETGGARPRSQRWPQSWAPPSHLPGGNDDDDLLRRAVVESAGLDLGGSTLVRLGGVLSGPVPLVMRTFQRSPGWRRGASVAALAGSLLTRIGWLLAGRVSAEGRLKKHASTDESDAYASTV